MRAGALLALAAAVAAVAPATAGATTIDDPAGDANGLGNAGLSLATAPASDATRDLTRVTVARDREGLTVRFALAARPQLDGPISFAILRGARGGCGVSLAVAWGSLVDDAGAGPIAVSDLDDCDDEFFGIGAPGYSVALEGSTLVARYPWSALAANRMGIGPATALRKLTAETRVGTFGSTGTFSHCHPDPCEAEGLNHTKSGFIGPIVDVTAQGDDLVAGELRRRSRRRAR
jgi:hypothetical protein